MAEASLPDLRREVSSVLAAMADGHRTLVVTYPESDVRLHLGDLVQRCVFHGVRGVLATPSLATLAAVTDAARFAAEGLVAVDRITPGGPAYQFGVPTLILLDPTEKPRLSWLGGSSGSLRILLLPDTTPDPQYPDHLVKNIRVPHWSLPYFLRTL